MKPWLKYLLLLAFIGLVGYNSIYIKKLSEVNENGTQQFNATSFSKDLWDQKLPARLDSAIDLSQLIRELSVNNEASLMKYTNALAIGNYCYALVKLQGTVTGISDDEMKTRIALPDSAINAVITTEFIYGNAIRDASRLVDIKDHPNTADLNSISEELNKIVRNTLVPSMKAAVKKGDQVNLVAAIELNKAHLHWNDLELIPLRFQTIH